MIPYSRYSVLIKLDFLDSSSSSTISIFSGLSLNATKVRIEKDLRASCTLRVDWAESLRPVNG